MTKENKYCKHLCKVSSNCASHLKLTCNKYEEITALSESLNYDSKRY